MEEDYLVHGLSYSVRYECGFMKYANSTFILSVFWKLCDCLTRASVYGDGKMEMKSLLSAERFQGANYVQIVSVFRAFSENGGEMVRVIMGCIKPTEQLL